MARDSSGTKNQPLYTGAGAPSTAADQSEISNYAANVGNRKAGLGGSTRTSLTGADVWVGLEYYETDTGYTYTYTATGWRMTSTPAVGCRIVKTTGGGATGGLTGAGAFAFATITFDSDATDPLDMHTTGAPSRITIPVAGWYTVHASFFGSATSTGYGIRLLKNGAGIEGLQSWDSGLGVNGLSSPQVGDTLLLAAGDYLEVQAASQQTTAQGISTSAGFCPVFSAVLVQTA